MDKKSSMVPQDLGAHRQMSMPCTDRDLEPVSAARALQRLDTIDNPVTEDGPLVRIDHRAIGAPLTTMIRWMDSSRLTY